MGSFWWTLGAGVVGLGMPLMGHYSFPGVMDEFLAHWSGVDAALVAGGGAGLVVLGGMGRPGFLALSGELRAKLAVLEGKDIGERIAAREILLRREVLLRWMGVFNDTVRLWWEGLPEGALVTQLPNTGAALEKVLRAARGVALLWARVDGGSAPAGMSLPLRVGAGTAPGLDRAEFLLLLQGLEDARDAQETAAFEVSALRVERDALEVRVRKVLSAYVRAVPALLGEGHALLGSVPRISPLPGHTPEPVAVRAEWSAEDGAGKISWETSADAALDHYEIRWCPGDVYDKKEERLALSIHKDADRVALVRNGLVVPGAESTFKVYVVLTTDNERGSAAMVVRSG